LKRRIGDQPASFFSDPKNIRNLIAEALQTGRKKGTVRAGLWQAVSNLLTHHLGRSERNRALAGVKAPTEDDTREVRLRPEEVRHLLECASEKLRPWIMAAILTGVDRGPLLRALVRDYDRELGVFRVRDTKTSYRPRVLELSAVARGVFDAGVAGKGLDDRIFDLTENAARVGWERARKKAGLQALRFKDLRHVFSDGWIASGGSLFSRTDG